MSGFSQHTTMSMMLMGIIVITTKVHTYSSSSYCKEARFFNKFKVKQEHAAKFGRLIIQDAGGRMKPINTFRQSYAKGKSCQ
jgi:hypothetical protein